MADFTRTRALVLYVMLLALWLAAGVTVFGIIPPFRDSGLPRLLVTVASMALAVAAVTCVSGWMSFAWISLVLLSPPAVLSGDVSVIGAASVVLVLCGIGGWAALPAALAPPFGITAVLVLTVRKDLWAVPVALAAGLVLWMGYRPVFWPSPWLWLSAILVFSSGLPLSERLVTVFVPLIMGLPQGAAAAAISHDSGFFRTALSVAILPAAAWLAAAPYLGHDQVSPLGREESPLRQTHDTVKSSVAKKPFNSTSYSSKLEQGSGRGISRIHLERQEKAVFTKSSSVGDASDAQFPDTSISSIMSPITDFDPCAEMESGTFQGRRTKSILSMLARAVPRKILSPNLGGRTVKFVMIMPGGVRTLFKPAHIRSHIAKPGAEVGMFRLGRMLGIGAVPPAVIRRFDGQMLRRVLLAAHSSGLELFDNRVLPEGSGMVTGAMIIWVKHARELVITPDMVRYYLTPGRRLSPGERRMAAQLADMSVLDYIGGNFDRLTGGNLLRDSSGHLYFIDNGAAFPGHGIASPEWRRQARKYLGRVRRDMLKRLISLRYRHFKQCLGDILPTGRIREAYVRTQELVAHFQGIMMQWGAKGVLVDENNASVP